MTAQTIAQAWSLISRWYSIPLLLLIWQVAVASGLVESRLLPSPGSVWTALATATCQIKSSSGIEYQREISDQACAMV